MNNTIPPEDSNTITPGKYIIVATKYAIEVFGNERKALTWLNARRAYLHGKTPMAIINTEEGFQEVMTLLGRIDHGIFS